MDAVGPNSVTESARYGYTVTLGALTVAMKADSILDKFASIALTCS